MCSAWALSLSRRRRQLLLSSTARVQYVRPAFHACGPPPPPPSLCTLQLLHSSVLHLHDTLNGLTKSHIASVVHWRFAGLFSNRRHRRQWLYPCSLGAVATSRQCLRLRPLAIDARLNFVALQPHTISYDPSSSCQPSRQYRLPTARCRATADGKS